MLAKIDASRAIGTTAVAPADADANAKLLSDLRRVEQDLAAAKEKYMKSIEEAIARLKKILQESPEKKEEIEEKINLLRSGQAIIL